MLGTTFADRDFIRDFASSIDTLENSDSLFGGGLAAGTPSASQFLSGASRTLATDRPVVLVSAHPAALAAAGSGEDDVVRALAVHGYAVRVLARDHEVHLLATPPVR